MMYRKSCAQVHELPQSLCRDKRESTFFFRDCVYIYMKKGEGIY